MFLSQEDTEFGTLRQGDILSEVHTLGAININGITYGYDIKNEPVSWQVNNKPFITDAMVLSHSCEIDPSNKVKMTSVILGAFRDINSATSKDKIEELIESNIIDNASEYSYLKYFYVEPHEKLSVSNGGVVDFSKCFSVRNNSYKYLLERKILQLKPAIAEKMALKLAYYFHRN